MRLFFIFILFISIPCTAQIRDYVILDSLTKQLAAMPEQQSRKRALLLNDIGSSYLSVSNYTGAATYFSQCLTIADKLKDDELIALTFQNLAIVAFFQKNHAKSEEYNLKALSIYERGNYQQRKAALLKNIGDNHLVMADSAKAREYYAAALNIYRNNGNKDGEAAVYANQSILLNTHYQQKLELAFKAKALFREINSNAAIDLVNTGNIGVAYLDLVRYNHYDSIQPSALIPAGKNNLLALAEKYIRETIAIAEKRNDPDNSSYFKGILAELQEYKGDFKSAYQNIRTYYETQDSIYSQANKNTIARLESQREIDLKNVEIQNQELQISNQRKRLLLLVASIGFLIVIGALIYRQSRIRKKINNRLVQLNIELDEANKIKAKFFGILTHDLRSPIANLMNYLELQKRNPELLNEMQRKNAEDKISAAGKTLLENMEALLLWSKSQMEHFKPQISKVSIPGLFNDVKEFFALSEKIKFEFDAPPQMSIDTDENFLRTIIYNLTSNAVTALDKQEDASIYWKAWEAHGESFLSISDNGQGFTEEFIRKWNENTVNVGGRKGLGMHIVRDMANAIHCTITLTAGKSPKGNVVIGFPGIS